MDIEMDIDLAGKLLKTFNNPVSAASEGYDLQNLRGGFISTRDYFDKPHCSCAYIDSNDGYAEFYLEWAGIEGYSDVSINLGESFCFSFGEYKPRNWLETVMVVKSFLKSVIDAE